MCTKKLDILATPSGVMVCILKDVRTVTRYHMYYMYNTVVIFQSYILVCTGTPIATRGRPSLPYNTALKMVAQLWSVGMRETGLRRCVMCWEQSSMKEETSTRLFNSSTKRNS